MRANGFKKSDTVGERRADCFLEACFRKLCPQPVCNILTTGQKLEYDVRVVFRKLVLSEAQKC